MDCTSPIGVFDSGLGGISVLRGIKKLLPGEDFIYYGDSQQAPYGGRSREEVQDLTEAAVEHLLQQNVKAVVIACNTATSASAADLRARYPDLPILGIEPALKPATEQHPGGRILVMATVRTLAGEKFRNSWKQYEDQAEIVPVPCSGLVEFVEQGILEGDELEQFLLDILSPYVKVPVDAVVLGCTHYPFVRKTLRKLLGRRPDFYEGSDGVARNLQHQLQQLNLQNPRAEGGQVLFQNSLNTPEILALSEKLLLTEDEE